MLFNSGRFNQYLILLAILLSHVSASFDFQGIKNSLITIKQAFGNPSSLDSWNGDDPSYWMGVNWQIDNSGSSVCVNELFLSNLNLQGNLPSELQNFPCLHTLDLSLNNGINGRIPSWIGNLNSLKILNLNDCDLEGALPIEFSRLTDLQTLILSRNRLTGSISIPMSNLKKLQILDLSHNSFSQKVPNFQNFPFLETLLLNHNSFSGLVASNIFGAPKLKTVILDSNSLNLFQLNPNSSVQILSMNNNPFDSYSPPDNANYSSLTQLSLSNCNLKGNVSYFNNFANLLKLDISSNAFSDRSPFLNNFKLNKLISLNLSNNKFTESVNEIFFNLSSLQSLLLQNNQFSSLPNSIQHNNLLLLNLSSNEISINTSSKLVYNLTSNVLAYNNPLCEELPSGAAICQKESSDFGQWKKSFSTSRCPNCVSGILNQALILFDPPLCNCSLPYDFYLSFSSTPFVLFTDYYASLLESKLNDLLVSSVIPYSKAFVQSATKSEINFELNLFLQIFPTNGYSVPERLNEKILKMFSNINYEIDFFGPFSVIQKNVDDANGNNNQSTTSQNDNKKSNDITSKNLAIIIAVILILLLSLILLFFSFYKIQKFRNQAKLSSPSLLGASFSSAETSDKQHLPGLNVLRLRPFSLKELRTSTDNFGSHNHLGNGSYGEVYKGRLVEGDVVAVKRAKKERKQSILKFKNEIELLSGVSHKNLVRLLGYCKEDGEQLLVYEFIGGGNLTQNLDANFRLRNDLPPLSWCDRLQLILGVGRALAYLHDQINSPFIHRDVKPSNVLVEISSDGSMVAKLADFGTSKSMGVDQLKTNKIHGTMGYIDPNYFRTAEANEKVDVYSFGIVLFEIISGIHPSTSNKPIRSRVLRLLSEEGVHAVVDESMGPYPEDEVLEVLDLAKRCTDLIHPQRRPAMSRVVTEMENLKSIQSVMILSITATPSFSQTSERGSELMDLSEQSKTISLTNMQKKDNNNNSSRNNNNHKMSKDGSNHDAKNTTEMSDSNASRTFDHSIVAVDVSLQPI